MERAEPLGVANLEDIIAVDDAGLDAQFLQKTHFGIALGNYKESLFGDERRVSNRIRCLSRKKVVQDRE